jgi:hypothetical protein
LKAVLLSNHETRSGFVLLQTGWNKAMMKKSHHNANVRCFQSLKRDAEDKVIGMGCIMLSAGLSFSMIAWVIHLVAEKGFPLM